MNKIILGMIFSTTLMAADQSGCQPKTETKMTGLLSQIDGQVKLQELENLAKANKDKVIKYLIEPTKKTCTTVSYKFSDIKMKPNESVYFHIPKDLRDRGVRFMVLGHRQEPGPNNVEGEWDKSPGLSSVQIFNDKGWNYWKGPSSGKNGAKFAEVRSYAEIENLYDWDNYGHVDLKTGKSSKSALLPHAMKVTSVGTDEVLLSELTLKVNPLKESSKEEFIFSKGTAFTPENPNHKYVLSGGQEYQGKFPGAKMIEGGNTINIPVKPGMKITSIDVACGDSHPDETKNSDGGWGTQGWAKLSIGIKNAKGEIKWLMSRENVPPQGILMTSPEDCDETTGENSEIVIKSDGDATYVMGVHVGYGN